MDRITFYSKDDLIVGYMLGKIEAALKKFDIHNVPTDINDIIELYQIKVYIDADLYLPSWSEETRENLKIKATKIWSIICLFFNTLSNDNIEAYYKSISEYDYKRVFWELFSKCNVFKRISEERFILLMNQTILKTSILTQKRIVAYYNTSIRNMLLTYDKAAEIILDKYERSSNYNNQHEIYLPQSLTLQDKEEIINHYLDWDSANLNYIQFIINSKTQSEFRISDKTRLKAKKRAQSEIEDFHKNGIISTLSIPFKIEFSQSSFTPKTCRRENDTWVLSYSLHYIEKYSDHISLFQNFQSLFEFFDSQSRISLVAHISDIDFLDFIGLHSAYAYPNNHVFQLKNNIAIAQIKAYELMLTKRGISLETIIQDTFNEFCIANSIDNLRIRCFLPNRSTLEKIRFILPELEFILKSYKLYVEDGNIDMELLGISSVPCRIQDIPSSVTKKYAYVIDKQTSHIQRIFFSNQTGLGYIKKLENKTKYQTLYELLLHEDIRFEDIEIYQQPTYQNLIASQYLCIDGNNYIRIQKQAELLLLKDLYTNGCIAYWHISSTYRDVLNQMYAKQQIEFKNTLFSDEEIKFFNYYLNKSEFTNGQDLRNKYIHGTHNIDKETIEQDYLRLLILLISIVWKIIDDVCTKERSQQA